ncbi:MAG: Gfo/Idh/MocA family oxidoreductase [Candidatus Methanomethylicus sp.]|nr:Gfo/Idh/MocA family oxidoreductase [Candidatus Methanomethylicus sp.]
MKVGVVGVGAMGGNHVRVYSSLQSCELVGIADMNDSLAKDLAEKYHTKAFHNYRDLLDAGVEAVSIAVPTSLHAEVASFFLKKNVNCLVEKPIASTVEDGLKMVELAKKSGKKLMVGHIERFNPAVQRIKEIIESGRLGRIVMITSRRVGPVPPRIVDVGIIIDLATHDIDIARYLYGEEPTKIFAKYGSIIHKKEDHAIILLDFGNGAAGIEVNWFTPHKVRTSVVTGTDGIAYVDYIEQKITIYNSRWMMEPKIDKEEPLKRELVNFIDCIEKDVEPMVTGMDGVRTLEVAIKCLSP